MDFHATAKFSVLTKGGTINEEETLGRAGNPPPAAAIRADNKPNEKSPAPPYLLPTSRGNPMDVLQDRSPEITLYVQQPQPQERTNDDDTMTTANTSSAAAATGTIGNIQIPDTPISMDSQHSTIPFLGDVATVDDIDNDDESLIVLPAFVGTTTTSSNMKNLHRPTVVAVSPTRTPSTTTRSVGPNVGQLREHDVLEDPQMQRLLQLWSNVHTMRSLPLETGLEDKDETFWQVFLRNLDVVAPPVAMTTTTNLLHQHHCPALTKARSFIPPACLNALYQLERKCPNEYHEWLQRIDTGTTTTTTGENSVVMVREQQGATLAVDDVVISSSSASNQTTTINQNNDCDGGGGAINVERSPPHDESSTQKDESSSSSIQREEKIITIVETKSDQKELVDDDKETSSSSSSSSVDQHKKKKQQKNTASLDGANGSSKNDGSTSPPIVTTTAETTPVTVVVGDDNRIADDVDEAVTVKTPIITEQTLAERWMDPTLRSLPIHNVTSMNMAAVLDALVPSRLSIVTLKAMNALYRLDSNGGYTADRYDLLLRQVEQSQNHQQCDDRNTTTNGVVTAIATTVGTTTSIESTITAEEAVGTAVGTDETTNSSTGSDSCTAPVMIGDVFVQEPDADIVVETNNNSRGIIAASLLVADNTETTTRNVEPLVMVVSSPPPDAAAAFAASSQTAKSSSTIAALVPEDQPEGADNDSTPVSSTSSLKSNDSSVGLDAPPPIPTMPLKMAGNNNPTIIGPSFSEIIKKTSIIPTTGPTFQTTGATTKQNIIVVKRSEPKTKFVPSLSAVVSISDSRPLKTAAAGVDDNQDLFDGAKIVVLTTSASGHTEITRQQNMVVDTISEEKIDGVMVVDGKEKANKAKQKALFNLSGSYGEYPQVFKRDPTGNLSFWGNFESFMKAKKRGTLLDELLYGKKADNDQHEDKSLLVLVSNQSLKQEVKARQKQALSILDALGIQYDTLDGADPINKGRRSELFALSGKPGQYPQFYVLGPSESLTHWGDWDHFETAHELGSLTKEFRGNNIISVDRDIGRDPVKKSPLALDGKLVCLISGQSIDRNVGLKQEMSYRIFTDKSIPYETIDGAEPTNKKLRNKLFAVSGLRAVYPQFFLLKNDQYTFVGDWEKLETYNEANAMGTFFKPVIKPTKTVEEPIAADADQKSSDKAPSNGDQSGSVKRTLSTQSTPVAENLSHGSTGAVDTTTKSVTFSNIAKNSTAVSEITFYGATSFVAKHALDYMLQVSLTLPGTRKITLAGRNADKIESLRKTLTDKMGNLRMLTPGASGRCTFDSFIADSSDSERLVLMASRTKVVACFAGPFAKFAEKVVAACAKVGTDYVDITGEVSWASTMRLKYSYLAEASGARIISFCGFDSVPSDLAIYAAAEIMKRKLGRSTAIASGTTWHYTIGSANAGTIQTVVEMPLNLRRCLFRSVPFLLDDPLALTHPRVRLDEQNNQKKNRLAKAEWLNQLVFFEYFLRLGWSAPFLMAPVNTKVVNASAVALEYGPEFVYYERFLPVGFRMTKAWSLLSLIPALLVQLGVLLIGFILKFPILGKIIAGTFFPAGTGMPDQNCRESLCQVYAEVATAEKNGKLDRVYCALRFEGDPGNWVTAQCVCESALALVLDRSKLPKRSMDGFGTPAELLGSALLNRLETTKVRPVEVKTYVQRNAGRDDRVLCHFE